MRNNTQSPGADLGGGWKGCAPFPEMTFGLVFALKICLCHQSVTAFLSGTPPPNKNLGSASGAIM